MLSFAYTWAKITADLDGSAVQDIYNLAQHGIVYDAASLRGELRSYLLGRMAHC